MNDAFNAWDLTRSRFVKSFEDLDEAALNWRAFPSWTTIAEQAIHVAGVELFLGYGMLGMEPTGEFEIRVMNAARDGLLNDEPFPFTAAELTKETVAKALAHAEHIVRPSLENPTPEIRNRELLTPLGPETDGNGALARLAYHAGYHQGQVTQIRSTPGFPG